MKTKLIIILIGILLVGILVYKENKLQRPAVLPEESCLFCHEKVSDPSKSHPISAFGCYSCHLGNPYSFDKKRSHFTMVKNPGDLAVVAATCGRTGCHLEITDKVKNSVMATNKGILNKLQRQWENPESSTVDVKDLLTNDIRENLAVDNYAKMCGGCHLWKEKGDFPGEIGKRGGGCSACHVVDKAEKLPQDIKKDIKKDLKKFTHSRITTRIPSENCIRCHNRSARIGLSYFGKFESAGYGTPYEGKNFSRRRLSGNRFFINLPADIHFKAGMECIDCHTRTGVMGDGKRYEYMEEQLDITCEACHQPRFSKITKDDSPAQKLSFLNKMMPDARGMEVALSGKDTQLYNLRKVENEVIFYRKLDGKPIKMDIPSKVKPYHNLPGHERLTCQACHSAWIPQCYGCHFTYRKDMRQRDWLSKKETWGKWKEGRSYMRFSKPTLGFRSLDKIAPFSPCQVFVSVFDKDGRYVEKESFEILKMTSFDPHTTVKNSRTCRDCHGDPKSLGLGEGILNLKAGKLSFRPTYDSLSSGLGITFSPDAFVDIDGKPLQADLKKELRPFNKKELKKIVSVNACLPCHYKYEDKIYQDFRISLRRFKMEKDLPCLQTTRKYMPQ